MVSQTKQLLILLFSFFIFLVPLSTSAQAYGTAVGVRLADGWGLTLQQQVALHTTVEAILSTALSKKDVTLTVLGEQHKSLLSRGFNLYFGGGFYKTWLQERTNVLVQPANPWGHQPDWWHGIDARQFQSVRRFQTDAQNQRRRCRNQDF